MGSFFFVRHGFIFKIQNMYVSKLSILFSHTDSDTYIYIYIYVRTDYVRGVVVIASLIHHHIYKKETSSAYSLP